MIVGAFTLIVTSGFSVTCAYVNIVEQPARLPLAPSALLAQWRVSYSRGTAMQLSLAILASVLGVITYVTTRDVRWLYGVGCLLAIAPYTLLVVMPVNRQLSAMSDADADDRVMPLVRSWGWRHAIRGALGFAATILFLWAMV